MFNFIALDVAKHLNILKFCANVTELNVLCFDLLWRTCFCPWQVYSKRYVDQMGKIGYFPATIVKETHRFVQDTVKRPTTVSMFFTFISTIFDSNRLQLTFIEIYSILSVFQDMDFYCD